MTNEVLGSLVTGATLSAESILSFAALSLLAGTLRRHCGHPNKLIMQIKRHGFNLCSGENNEMALALWGAGRCCDSLWN